MTNLWSMIFFGNEDDKNKIPSPPSETNEKTNNEDIVGAKTETKQQSKQDEEQKTGDDDKVDIENYFFQANLTFTNRKINQRLNKLKAIMEKTERNLIRIIPF